MDLEESFDALDLSPTVRSEFRADPERASGWIEWARKTGTDTGIVVYRFRTGAKAPDLDAFYEQAGKGPDYGTLLRVCTQLVENTGHEYLRDDLEEEFARLGRASKVGNGTRLNPDDKTRLLMRADELRDRWEAQEPERQAARDKWKKQYDQRFKHQRKTLKELDAAP